MRKGQTLYILNPLYTNDVRTELDNYRYFAEAFERNYPALLEQCHFEAAFLHQDVSRTDIPRHSTHVIVRSERLGKGEYIRSFLAEHEHELENIAIGLIDGSRAYDFEAFSICYRHSAKVSPGCLPIDILLLEASAKSAKRSNVLRIAW